MPKKKVKPPIPSSSAAGNVIKTAVLQHSSSVLAAGERSAASGVIPDCNVFISPLKPGVSRVFTNENSSSSESQPVWETDSEFESTNSKGQKVIPGSVAGTATHAVTNGDVASQKVTNQHQTAKKASWANLFKDNRDPKQGMKLEFIENKQKNVLVFEEKDVADVEALWGHCLVGFFAAKFPGKHALLQLCNSWNVKYKYYTHSSGWLVFKFENSTDRESVLNGGPYFVYGRPLFLKIMPQDFDFGNDGLSIIPVWVNLPRLPFCCWNCRGISMVASCVGRPVLTDKLTYTKDTYAFARVLVEVDASKDLIRSIELRLPTGKITQQEVIYEFEPKFCATCRSFGHTTEGCKVLHEAVKTGTTSNATGDGAFNDAATNVKGTEAAAQVHKPISAGNNSNQHSGNAGKQRVSPVTTPHKAAKPKAAATPNSNFATTAGGTTSIHQTVIDVSPHKTDAARALFEQDNAAAIFLPSKEFPLNNDLVADADTSVQVSAQPEISQQEEQEVPFNLVTKKKKKKPTELQPTVNERVKSGHQAGGGKRDIKKGQGPSIYHK